MIETDPIAACVRELMSERSYWNGSAADLLRVTAERTGLARDNTGWPKNPRALAGRLRRAQTFLRALGIDITFSREGRAGSRVIRMRRSLENTVSTVSTGHGPDAVQHSSGSANEGCDDSRRLDSRATPHAFSLNADDADGADAKKPAALPCL
jgi:hypothetical protein